MVKLKLQKKKTKTYIQFIENIIQDCFLNQKIRIGITHNKRQHEIEGTTIALDKINHLLVIEKNDGINILPIKNITYIETIH